MRTLKIGLLASAALVTISSAAFAADPIVMLDEPVIDNFASADYGWDGVYGGLYVSGQTMPAVYGLGANLGVNVLMDAVLIGIEGDIAYLGNATWQGQVHGKLGALVTDEFAIYGLAGVGAHSTSGTYVPAGIGGELMVSENFSLKAQYEYHWDLDNSADNAHVGKVGFNFHF